MHRSAYLLVAALSLAALPVRAVDWVRSGLNTNQPVWGIRGRLLWALPPGGFPAPGGPRGLIRLGYPNLTNGSYQLINFIAVEPVVKGNRGLSELEYSRLDQTQGKRLWAVDAAPGGSAATAKDLLPGSLSQPAPGVEQLELTVAVERFDNGAHVRLVLSQRSDAPEELQLAVHAEPDSAPLEYCLLTATMGNKARTRQLWLKDEMVCSHQLYPDHRGNGFAPHRSYPLGRLTRTAEQDVLVAVTPDETKPAAVFPFPGRRAWHYDGCPLTQYWKQSHSMVRDDLQAVVNARYTYWKSQQPIPGGVAFENFELQERFYEGQAFVFGISRKTPAELGLTGHTQPAVALTHVTVVDGTGAKPKSDQTVLVTGDRIATVGASRRVKLPSGTVVVNGTGKFLIPGLWDMHVHIVDLPHAAELNIANGVTGVRDMFGPMTNIVAERQAIANGKPGPRIVAAGRILDGPQPVWPGSATAKDAEEGRRSVQLLKQEGSDFIKVYERLPRDAYFAIAAEAKRQGLVFAGHVPQAIRAWEASDAGQKSIEHLTRVLRGCSSQEAELMRPEPVGGTNQSGSERFAAMLKTAMATYDEKQAQALFARFKRNHTWQCPTLTVLHNITHLSDRSLTNDARLRYIDAETLAFWPKPLAPASEPPERSAVLDQGWRKHQELVGKMRRAGVTFLAGTDTPNPYCLPGFSLHDELAWLVSSGLTPMEALQAATLNPARYLGREKELGSVEAGKLADLVLLDANPLQDIHNTTRIRAVLANGHLYNREALDHLLSAAEADAQATKHAR